MLHYEHTEDKDYRKLIASSEKGRYTWAIWQSPRTGAYVAIAREYLFPVLKSAMGKNPVIEAHTFEVIGDDDTDITKVDWEKEVTSLLDNVETVGVEE